MGGYCLYNGLCEVLGAENVVDYPYKRSYHGEVQTYPSFYATGVGLTGPFAWARARPGVERNSQQITDMLRDRAFDLVVCESPRIVVLDALRSLYDLLPPRIVFHDGEDSDVVRADLIASFRLRLYLKRELLRHAQSPMGCAVKPFPFSYYLHDLPPPAGKPTVDILYAVGNTHPVRQVVLSVVERLGLSIDTNRYSWGDYIERIRQARIAIAPRGFGRDTMRRWEIPGAGGALLLAEKLDIVEDDPLIDGVHCATYWPDLSDLEIKIRHWLADEGSRRRVAEEGRRFVHERHTNVARARQVLKWVGEVWG